MTLEQLRVIDRKYRKEKPNLFRMVDADPLATELQLSEVERNLGIALSGSYRSFLKEFGGGEFGLTVIFSADPRSEWYLPVQQALASKYLPDNLLAFSDDFAGGYYVFRIENGAANESVFYWNTGDGLSKTKFADLLEFVVMNAYGISGLL